MCLPKHVLFDSAGGSKAPTINCLIIYSFERDVLSELIVSVVL